MNKAIIYGRVCKDVDFRQTPSGVSVAKFTVAADRKYADKQTGERKADFISCVAFRNTAEFVSRYFNKGSAIIVEGSLQNNNYTDNNGVKHYAMVVNVDNVSFCGSKNDSNNAQNAPQQPQYNSGTSYSSAQQNGNTTQQNGYQQTMYSNPDIGDYEDVLSDGSIPF